jgi:hypothetical protein
VLPNLIVLSHARATAATVANCGRLVVP